MPESKSYEAEVTESGYREGDEWGFRASVRVRLHNPNGPDVVAVNTYKARPKYDDLTSVPEEVHQHIDYWWPDSYPSQGDSPFTDASLSWEPSADVEDDDELFDECLGNAVYDPQAHLESLNLEDR